MNEFTKFSIFLLTIVLLGVGFYFYNIDNFENNFPSFEEVVESIKNSPREVITSSPLRGPTEPVDESYLTVSGIVLETNKHRLEHGLEPLSTNFILHNAAEMKVEDMFALQYFAHESPTGEGPSDLADAAGYDYLMIGENLALGNYKNDLVLVQAWMDSPGHRANILNSKYTEIGVSVKKDFYKGNLVWIAVQEFGRPVSDCPSINEFLKVQIDENKKLLEEWSRELEQKKKELDQHPRQSPQNKRKTEEYNELVNQYNELLEETRYLVEKYNEEVEEYNLCI
ncbi:MAG: CAP domain-containing protein [Candidatus Paceibacterota bacterium]